MTEGDRLTAHRVSWGGLDRCPHVSPTRLERFVVHACKDPCHRAAVRYTTKSLPESHPSYLAQEMGEVWSAEQGEPGPMDLYLNIIDPPIPLFKVETFKLALQFIERWIPYGDVLVHCNKGESRAPSIALLWMARIGDLPSSSYQLAAASFVARGLTIPYHPGKGIEEFLKTRWHEILDGSAVEQPGSSPGS